MITVERNQHSKYLHEIHVVQSHVVELRVVDDGRGAGVVSSVHQSQHLHWIDYRGCR